ncbi:MAG: PilZ domain-containing protein [Deltaproteobacteria bacterium]|nr:PilZ domain-containing protein [Deltaproteobacteria bacterium]MBW2192209.1 PilZ domain-containing protein [Deltaproteobacteria bacterium]
MNDNPQEGSERRNFFRITYNPERRPVLRIGEYEFEIADISEGGIRIINEGKLEIEKPVRGTAKFLYGGSIDIEGDIVWKQNSEFGLLLKNLIPSAAMEKEQRYVILDNG